MNKHLRNSLRAASIMIMIWWLHRILYTFKHFMANANWLAREMYWQGWFALLLGAILVVAFALLANKNHLPRLSKPMTIFTAILAIVMCIVILWNMIDRVMLGGLNYCWSPQWLVMYTIPIASSAWLWMYSCQKETITMTQTLYVVIIASIVLIFAVWFLGVNSFCYYLECGGLHYFHTGWMENWLRILIPAAFFVAHLIANRQANNNSLDKKQ